MADHNSVTITNADSSAGPTLEESYNSLVEEGLISDDAGGTGAQGEAGGDSQGLTDERPDWLPSKFKTPEDMAKAYAELERKLSGKKADGVSDDAAAGTDDADGAGADDSSGDTQVTEAERKAAEEATAKAGLDLNEVSKEWYENGGLKDATYEKLAKAGYPRELVDVYIDGLVSRTGNIQAEAYGVAGGTEGYQEMTSWAAENMTEAEIDAYNKEVNSGDRNRVIRAVKALHRDYIEATKSDSVEPEDHITGSAGATAADVYETEDDYMADLLDPRYDTNETFRRKVMAKLARSKIM